MSLLCASKRGEGAMRCMARPLWLSVGRGSMPRPESGPRARSSPELRWLVRMRSSAPSAVMTPTVQEGAVRCRSQQHGHAPPIRRDVGTSPSDHIGQCARSAASRAHAAAAAHEGSFVVADQDGDARGHGNESWRLPSRDGHGCEPGKTVGNAGTWQAAVRRHALSAGRCNLLDDCRKCDDGAGWFGIGRNIGGRRFARRTERTHIALERS